MSEHHAFKVIGVNAVNPNWDGSPTTLQPNDTNNMAPTPTGSLVILSQKLWASEVIRRIRPALEGQDVEVRLAA